MNLDIMRKDYDIYKLLYESTHCYHSGVLLKKIEESIRTTYITKAIQATINRNHIKVFIPERCMWGKIFTDPTKLNYCVDGKYNVLKYDFWYKPNGYYNNYLIWYENGSVENVYLDTKKQNVAAVINSSMKYVFFRDYTFKCYNCGFKLSKWNYSKEVTEEFIEKIEKDKLDFNKIKKPKKRNISIKLTDVIAYADHASGRRITAPLKSFLDFIITGKHGDDDYRYIRLKRSFVNMISLLIKTLFQKDDDFADKNLFDLVYGPSIVNNAILSQIMKQKITRENIIADIKTFKKYPYKNNLIMVDIMNQCDEFIDRFYNLNPKKPAREDIVFIVLESISNLITILNHIDDKEYEDIKKIMLDKEVLCFQNPEDNKKFSGMLTKLYNEIVSIA